MPVIFFLIFNNNSKGNLAAIVRLDFLLNFIIVACLVVTLFHSQNDVCAGRLPYYFVIFRHLLFKLPCFKNVSIFGRLLAYMANCYKHYDKRKPGVDLLTITKECCQEQNLRCTFGNDTTKYSNQYWCIPDDRYGGRL